MGPISRKQSLAALLCVLLLLVSAAGCASEPSSVRKPVIPDYEAMTPIEEDSGTVDVAENDSLRLSLWFDPLNIVIEDKKTGMIWAANPTEADLDAGATEDMKAYLKSQLMFSYIVNRNRRTVESFTECDETGQIKAWRIGNGVRLEYTFGDMGIGENDIPMKLTPERADELFLQNPALSEEEAALFQDCYVWDEELSAWTYSEYNFGSKVEDLFTLFEKIEYSGEDLVADAAAFGETAEVREKVGFTIPVEYTLDGDTLVTRIPVEQIIYPAEYPILDLTLNGYFGAADNEEEGYILIPDGSGALMRFAGASPVKTEVNLPIYGPDLVNTDTGSHARTQPALLPVYGLKTGENAFFAVIEQGDAVSSLQVTPAGFNSSYNSVAPNFVLHARGSMYLGVGDSNNEVTVVEAEGYRQDIRIRYAFLSGDKADYAGMADWYRTYLAEHQGYVSRKTDAPLPLFLETVGAVGAQQSFLGINYQGTETLTTFAQTGDMIRDLKQNGVVNPVVRLSGWFNGGYEQQVAKKMDIIGKLGGKKGLMKLAAENGGIYPGVRFQTAPSSKGVSLTSQAARRIDEQYARTYVYDIETDEFEAEEYILSPAYYSQLTQSFLKSYRQLKIGTLCVEDMGAGVYADYSKSRGIDRQEALDTVVTVLSGMEEFDLMLPGANARTAKFASYIPEAPMDSSHYFALDDDVPFYQMVMGAYAVYSGSPLNLSSQSEADFLKNLLYGGVPSYKLIAASADSIIRSDNDDLYSVVYDDWAATVYEQYRRAAALLEPVAGAYIVALEQAEENVFRASYSNGKAIAVNTGRQDAVVDGVTVPSMDAVLIG